MFFKVIHQQNLRDKSSIKEYHSTRRAIFTVYIRAKPGHNVINGAFRLDGNMETLIGTAEPVTNFNTNGQ
jgi:hypothetical protein